LLPLSRHLICGNNTVVENTIPVHRDTVKTFHRAQLRSKRIGSLRYELTEDINAKLEEYRWSDRAGIIDGALHGKTGCVI